MLAKYSLARPIVQRCFSSTVISPSLGAQTVDKDKTETSRRTFQRNNLPNRVTYSRSQANVRHPSSLVLLLPWANAKENNVSKFEQYYLSQGFNVLTVRTVPRQCTASRVYNNRRVSLLVEELANPVNIEQFDKVLAHAFSIGHFTLGHLLKQSQQTESGLQNVPISVILDSPLPLYRTHFAHSFVQPIQFSPGVRKLFEKMSEVTLSKMFPFLGMSQNVAIYDTLHNPPFKSAMVITSEKDPISSPEYAQQLMDKYQKLNIPTSGKIFKSSAHCMHFVQNKDIYVNMAQKFISDFLRIQVENNK